MTRMKPYWTYRFWRSAAQCLLASIAVALLTFVSFQLRVNLTIACLLYPTVVVLLSAAGGFVPSVFVSISAFYAWRTCSCRRYSPYGWTTRWTLQL